VEVTRGVVVTGAEGNDLLLGELGERPKGENEPLKEGGKGGESN